MKKGPKRDHLTLFPPPSPTTFVKNPQLCQFGYSTFITNISHPLWHREAQVKITQIPFACLTLQVLHLPVSIMQVKIGQSHPSESQKSQYLCITVRPIWSRTSIRIMLNFLLPFGIPLVHGAMEPEWFQAYLADHRQPSDRHLYSAAKTPCTLLQPIYFEIRSSFLLSLV